MQMIGWLIDTDTCPCKSRNATHSHIHFELSTLSALDEALNVHGTLDNVDMTSFLVNRRPNRFIVGLFNKSILIKA